MGIIFQPAKIMREIAKEIANEYDLVDDWLNDGVKGFLVEHPRAVFLNLSHLIVMAADPEYTLTLHKYLVQKRFARSISGHQETIDHFQDLTVCSIRFHP